MPRWAACLQKSYRPDLRDGDYANARADVGLKSKPKLRTSQAVQLEARKRLTRRNKLRILLTGQSVTFGSVLMQTNLLRGMYLLIPAIVALALTGCARPQPSGEDVRPVRTVTVSPQVAATAAELAGEVRPRIE